jgi:hypothetical protein
MSLAMTLKKDPKAVNDVSKKIVGTQRNDEP